MTLNVSIMSHHVFIMIWYHNESLLLTSMSPNGLIALGTQYLFKDLNSTALDRTVLVQHSLV